MAYLHPILGTIAVALMFFIGAQGVRARHPKPYAPRARALHRRWAPVMLVLVVLGALGGTLTVEYGRADLETGATWHFRIGWAVAGLLVAAGMIAHKIPQSATARVVHPLLGFVALTGATAIAALGLDLLP